MNQVTYSVEKYGQNAQKRSADVGSCPSSAPQPSMARGLSPKVKDVGRNKEEALLVSVGFEAYAETDSQSTKRCYLREVDTYMDAICPFDQHLCPGSYYFGVLRTAFPVHYFPVSVMEYLPHNCGIVPFGSNVCPILVTEDNWRNHSVLGGHYPLEIFLNSLQICILLIMSLSFSFPFSEKMSLHDRFSYLLQLLRSGCPLALADYRAIADRIGFCFVSTNEDPFEGGIAFPDIPPSRIRQIVKRKTTSISNGKNLVKVLVMMMLSAVQGAIPVERPSEPNYFSTFWITAATLLLMIADMTCTRNLMKRLSKKLQKKNKDSFARAVKLAKKAMFQEDEDIEFQAECFSPGQAYPGSRPLAKYEDLNYEYSVPIVVVEPLCLAEDFDRFFFPFRVCKNFSNLFGHFLTFLISLPCLVLINFFELQFWVIEVTYRSVVRFLTRILDNLIFFFVFQGSRIYDCLCRIYDHDISYALPVKIFTVIPLSWLYDSGYLDVGPCLFVIVGWYSFVQNLDPSSFKAISRYDKTLEKTFFSDKMEKALQSGASMAAKAEEDSVVESLDVPSLIGSEKKTKLELNTVSREIALANNPILNVLSKSNVVIDIIDFFISIFLGPRKSERGVTICAIYYSNTLRRLAASLLNNDAAYKVFQAIMKDCELDKLFGQTKTVVGQEEEVAPDTWFSSLGDILDSTQGFNASVVGTGAVKFLSFLSMAPIFYSQVLKSETMLDMYTNLYKSLSKTTVTLAGVVASIVTVTTTIGVAAKSGNYSGVMHSLLVDDSSQQFVKCRRWVNLVKTGDLTPKNVDCEKIRYELCKLQKALPRNKPYKAMTAVEVSKHTAIQDLLDDFDKAVIPMMDKTSEFAFSLVGAPGIGKSYLIPYIMRLLHQWKGIEDIMRLGYPRLDCKHHNGLFNTTTAMVVDDQAAIWPHKREKTMHSLAIDLVNSRWVLMEKANVESKDNCWFRHYFVMWIDNCRDRGLKREAACEMAGERRFGHTFEVFLNPYYADEQGKLDTSIPVKNFEHLEFQEYVAVVEDGMVTYNDVGSRLTFTEYVYKLKDRFDQHYAREKRNLKEKATKSKLDLCPECGVLPQSLCKCTSKTWVSAWDTPQHDLSSDSSSGGLGSSSADSGMLTADHSLDMGPLFPSLPDDCSEITTEEVLKKSFRPLHRGEAVPDLRSCFPLFFTEYNARQTRAELIAVWTRIHMMGDSWKSSLMEFMYRWFIPEQFLLLFLLFSTRELQEGFQLVILCSIWVGILVLLKILREVRKQFVMLSMEEAHEILGRHIHNMSDTVKSIMITGSLLMLLKSAASYSGFFSPSEKKKEEEEVRKVTSLTGFVGNNEASAASSICSGPVYKEKKFEDIVQKAPWAQPIRVRPIANKCAHTISIEDMVEKIRGNQYLAKNLTTVDHASHFTAIDSNLWVSVGHQYILDDTVPDWHEIKFYDNKTNTSRIVKVHHSAIHLTQSKDLAFIAIDRLFGDQKDLSKYFAVNPGGGEKRSLILVTRDLSTGSPEPHQIVSTSSVEVSYRCGNFDFVDFSALSYNSPTGSVNGQCGALLFSEHSPRCIEAMHVAGNKVQSCIATLLTYDMIEDARKHFRSCGLLPPLELAALPKLVGGDPMNVSQSINPSNPVNFMPEGNIVQVLGEQPKNYSPRSALVKNPNLSAAVQILGLKTGLKVIPKMQWKKTLGNILVHGTARLPQPRLDLLSKSLEEIRRRIPKAVEKTKELYPDLPLDRTLRLSEVLNGIAKTPRSAFKKQTAAGNPGGGKKVEHLVLMPDGTYTLRAESAIQLDYMLRRLSEGYTPGTVTNIVLKDEMVKPEKSELTRGFCSVTIYNYIIDLIFCGGIMEVATANSSEFQTGIGLNRVGPAWGDFVMPFLEPEFANNCCDADFKCFDMTQSPFLRSAALMILVDIARASGWDEKDLDMLEKVLSVHLNPVVNCGGTIAVVINLLLSGILVTALVNGLVNSILSRYDFYLFCEEKGIVLEYGEHMRVVTLGDDLVNACSDHLRSLGWSVNHLRSTVESLGMKLTTADKTGDVFEFKTFSECEFLKSSLYYNEDLQAYVNVVGPKSYFRSFECYIPSKEITYSEHQMELLENAATEAFFGGRMAFNALHPKLIEYSEACGFVPSIHLMKSYDVRLDEQRLKFVTPQQKLQETGEIGYQMLLEYWSLPTFAGEGMKDYVGNAESDATASVEIAGIAQDTSMVVEAVGTTAPNTLIERLPIDPTTNPKKMLERKFLLASHNLTSTGDSIGFMNPYKEMFKKNIVTNQLRNVKQFRADIKITLEPSAPVNVAGLVMVIGRRYPKVTGGRDQEGSFPLNIRIGLGLQKEHMLVPIGNNSGKQEIIFPYLGKHPFINMRDKDSFDDMLVLDFLMAAPLVCSLDVNPRGYVNVYGEFVNITCGGATAYVGETEPEEKFSDKVSALADIGVMMSDLPGFGSLLLPSQIVKKGAGLAHHYGFSQPLDVSGNYVVPTSGVGMSNGRGAIPSRVLSVDPSQNVSPSGVLAGISEDELSFMFFLRKWGLISRFVLRSSAQVGEHLIQIGVTPAMFVPFGPAPNARCLPTPSALVSMWFRYWSGSIRYKVMLNIPSGVSGSMRILYEPDPDYSAETEGDSNMYIDMDFADASELEFVVHWSSTRAVLHVMGPNWRAPRNNEFSIPEGILCNGHFSIFVMKPIEASGNSDFTMTCMVLSKVEDNFKVFDYDPGNIATWQMDSDIPNPPDPPAPPLQKRNRTSHDSVCFTSAGSCSQTALNAAPTGTVPPPTPAPMSSPVVFVPPTNPPASMNPTESTVPPTKIPTKVPTATPITLIPTSQPTSQKPTMQPTSQKPTSSPTKPPYTTPSVLRGGLKPTVIGSSGFFTISPTGAEELVFPPNSVSSVEYWTVYNDGMIGGGLVNTLTMSGTNLGHAKMTVGTRTENAQSATSANWWTAPPSEAGSVNVTGAFSTVSSAETGDAIVTGITLRTPGNTNYMVWKAYDDVALDAAETLDVNGNPVTGGFLPSTGWPKMDTIWNGIASSLTHFPLVVVFEGSIIYDGVTYTHDRLKSAFFTYPKGTVPHIASPPGNQNRAFIYSVATLIVPWAAESTPSPTFEFGTKNSNEDILSGYAGEQIVSFRTLLKVAQHQQDYHVFGSDDIAVTPIASPNYPRYNREVPITLFNYLSYCFVGIRGGAISHLHMFGEGSIEISKAPTFLDPLGTSVGYSGIEMCDSRVNPCVSIKIPYTNDSAFFWSGNSTPAETYGAYKVLTAKSIGPFTVSEYWSSAEDFSFLIFQGAALLLTNTS